MWLATQVRDLWAMKAGLVAALLLALLAAGAILFGISLAPPAIKGPSLQVGAASTHVLVDTPRSSLNDLRQDTSDLRSLSNRAVLVGTLMASPPVREFIARRSGVAAGQIRALPPLTPDQPRVIAGAEYEPGTSDLLQKPDGYRLDIQANPTTPLLDIYTQAPNAEAAETLANAAVDGLQDYLDKVSVERGTALESQVELEQLGRAEGGVINKGAGVTAALLAFVATFTAVSALILFVARARRRWVATPAVETPTSARLS